jgi:hypothetical protein
MGQLIEKILPCQVFFLEKIEQIKIPATKIRHSG